MPTAYHLAQNFNGDQETKNGALDSRGPDP